MAKVKKFTIEIKDLPEDVELNEELLKKVTGGVLSIKPPIAKKPVASGDCDCWSYTACNCRA